jgi:hypothetical protein
MHGNTGFYFNKHAIEGTPIENLRIGKGFEISYPFKNFTIGKKWMIFVPSQQFPQIVTESVRPAKFASPVYNQKAIFRFWSPTVKDYVEDTDYVLNEDDFAVVKISSEPGACGAPYLQCQHIIAIHEGSIVKSGTNLSHGILTQTISQDLFDKSFHLN